MLSLMLIVSVLSLANLIFLEAAEPNCIDCVPYIYCKKAKDMASDINESTTNLFSQSKCGEHRNFTKVCCSEFERLAAEAASRVQVITRFATEEDKHRNLHLLPEKCGYTGVTERIIGGDIADLYEFPWMVLLAYRIYDNIQFMCSGTLISSKYVLTAAHCVVDKDIYNVRIGDYDLRYSEDCQDQICESFLQHRNVEKIIVHEEYKAIATFNNDIALLRLDAPVDLTLRNAQAVCLPTARELMDTPLTDRAGTVAGWGLTEHNMQSTLLLKVVIPIRSYQICQGFHREMNNVTQFCAGTPRKDSCKGDSGGPLMIIDMYRGSFKYIQYGIVSSGPVACGREVPGIYTDVRNYVNWILDKIEE